jgi:putative membrane protein
MKCRLSITLLAVAALALTLTRGASGQNLNDADRTFITDVSEINTTEIQVGQLAQQNAANDAVRKFSQRLVTDHMQMQKELRTLAQNKNVSLPKQAGEEATKLMDQLSKLGGGDFDRTFAKDMLDGHEKAMQKFEAEIKGGQDPEVKAFAEKWIKGIKEHREMARSISNDLNK